MSPIRVALINLPPILAQIVSEVLEKPDIQVAERHPDVVIVGIADDSADEDGLPPECRKLFSRHPWARVLSLAHDGREAVLHELHPHRTVLGEASPEKLLETIRGARAQA